MMYLITQPEVAYFKDNNEVVAYWFPPENQFFKFSIEEFPNGIDVEEAKNTVLAYDEPVQLSNEEIKKYKKYKS
jgi:hypothetical protein